MSNGTQFIEDWTGDQIGQPPSNWTNLYGGSGITAEIVELEDRFITTGRGLKITSTTSNPRVLTWDTVGSADPGRESQHLPPSQAGLLARLPDATRRAVTDERGRKRPDVPAGTPRVGNTDGEWHLIKTPVELSTNPNCQRCQPIPDAVEVTAQDLGLEPRDPLDVWAIMGER